MKDIKWCVPSLLHLDPPTKQSELEVRRIMHLQNIANQLPDAFADTKLVTKSHIPAANAPARIEIPHERAKADDTRESKTRLKRGRPVGSKDKNPRKRKEVEKHDDPKITEKKELYQKSGDCPDGSIERISAQPRSPAGRGTNVPRSAKLVRPSEVSAKVQNHSADHAITTRETHCPRSATPQRHATTAHDQSARAGKVSLAAAQLVRVPADAPSEPGKNVPRPAEISSAKFIRRPRRPTESVRPRPFRLGHDRLSGRSSRRPSQRRGRPEALFEAQTYVFKPGLTLSRL
ncbi:unnamed protein product [Microthlaspi erraticum]|uniref:Uncharacterized protein n=1 Tax=Microthlaspi erraticum TaxID=1685480 RepID=A0A6D2JDS3_9BRAS|nr:unnamed protein product [Microthlaspi erraticum]